MNLYTRILRLTISKIQTQNIITSSQKLPDSLTFSGNLVLAELTVLSNPTYAREAFVALWTPSINTLITTSASNFLHIR